MWFIVTRIPVLSGSQSTIILILHTLLIMHRMFDMALSHMLLQQVTLGGKGVPLLSHKCTNALGKLEMDTLWCHILQHTV